MLIDVANDRDYLPSTQRVMFLSPTPLFRSGCFDFVCKQLAQLCRAPCFLRSSRKHFEIGVPLSGTQNAERQDQFDRWSRIESGSSKNRARANLRQSGNANLILFAPHAFASQGQEGPSALPSPLVFRTISTDFTPTPCVLCTSNPLKFRRIPGTSTVKRWALTRDAQNPLHALYAQ